MTLKYLLCHMTASTMNAGLIPESIPHLDNYWWSMEGGHRNYEDLLLLG